MEASIGTAMVVVALAAGLWWGFSRGRRKGSLELLSITALALAGVTLVVTGLRWQLVPWQVLSLAVAAAAQNLGNGRAPEAAGAGRGTARDGSTWKTLGRLDVLRR